MLAPQSGQTKLRTAEIKLMLVFPNATNEAIIPLPFRWFFTAEMHRTINGDRRRGSGRAPVEGAAAPRFGFTSSATELPNALLGRCMSISFQGALSSPHARKRLGASKASGPREFGWITAWGSFPKNWLKSLRSPVAFERT